MTLFHAVGYAVFFVGAIAFARRLLASYFRPALSDQLLALVQALALLMWPLVGLIMSGHDHTGLLAELTFVSFPVAVSYVIARPVWLRLLALPYYQLKSEEDQDRFYITVWMWCLVLSCIACCTYKQAILWLARKLVGVQVIGGAHYNSTTVLLCLVGTAIAMRLLLHARRAAKPVWVEDEQDELDELVD